MKTAKQLDEMLDDFFISVSLPVDPKEPIDYVAQNTGGVAHALRMTNTLLFGVIERLDRVIALLENRL